MRKLLLPSLVVLLFITFSGQAQSSRISELAEQLQQNIGDLAERSTKDFFSRSANNRDQLNNFLVSQQLKATVDSFILLVNNNRPNSELRDAADSLNDRFSRYNFDSSNRPQLQEIKQNIDSLFEELKKTTNSPEKKTDKKNEILGKLHWQGTIDDEVQLIIRAGAVQVKTISGTEYFDGIFSFTAPLPSEDVQVSVNKKQGRGTVKVIQQPNSDNSFTAIIQILDKNGGAREYELEISWTK